ncbi:hypothetical protein OZX65_03105 [Leuconostocaceae bacterium ESL0723]|nr:hypothetical protein [Lactobacillaceae bacterium L1_55_11]WEV55063.1 hypothetical protein OZX65_03105 [Leuconostocaceae bacterium ESL0723]
MAKADEENASGFHVGDVLLAPAYGNLDQPFTGKVEKVYDNALLVEIIENAPADQAAVNEMNHRAVVRMSEVEVIQAAPQPKEEDGE